MDRVRRQITQGLSLSPFSGVLSNLGLFSSRAKVTKATAAFAKKLRLSNIRAERIIRQSVLDDVAGKLVSDSESFSTEAWANSFEEFVELGNGVPESFHALLKKKTEPGQVVLTKEGFSTVSQEQSQKAMNRINELKDIEPSFDDNDEKRYKETPIGRRRELMYYFHRQCPKTFAKPLPLSYGAM